MRVRRPEDEARGGPRAPGGLGSRVLPSDAGPKLFDLVGRTTGEVRARLGPPRVRRLVGRELWLVYRNADLTLRFRCSRAGPGQKSAASEPRVASWTARFREGRRTLREATEAYGLWPGCAPDADAASATGPLLRRALRSGDRVHSFTARVRDGRIDQITVYDETPEWGHSDRAFGDAPSGSVAKREDER